MGILSARSAATKVSVAKAQPLTKKIGIFSGTFDPVHKGHIAFALRAAEAAGLDRVYFLPEAVPRRKEGVTHIAHRIAMLRLATKPHAKLAVLNLPDKQFSVSRTLPRLQKRFQAAELHLLIGSDIVPFLASGAWPQADRLLASMRLIVGLRDDVDQEVVSTLQTLLPDRSFRIVQTDSAFASSRDIRNSLRRGQPHAGALKSLNRYIKAHWLYVSIADKKS